ncbi:sugar transferase [Patescibacteria group bacterium]|nr:sugar transferase [Patescibacteria group bacterium]
MKLRLFFATIQLPVDYVMLVSAALVAYFIRFESIYAELTPAVSIIPYNWYFLLSFTIPLAWLLIFALNGLYKIKERKFFDDIPKIIFACSTGIVFVIALIFFNREFFASRFIILAVWVLSIIFVSFGRMMIKFIYYLFKKRGIGILQVAVIGSGKVYEAIKNEFLENPVLGRKTVAFFPVLDEMAQYALKNLKLEKKIDEIIYSGAPTRDAHIELLRFCEEMRINFKYSADFFSTTLKNIEMTTIAGIPMVEVKRTRLDGWAKVYKRIFDIIGSFFLMILFFPIMLAVAIAIKLDKSAPGPIFWSHLDDGKKAKRIGEDGAPFNYFKFRSMKINTHNMRYEELAELNERLGTPMVKIKNDPRVGRVGRFIRRYSLDELPEFFLVFKGDMSLVGPRPHLPEEVSNYSGHHKQVLSIKPGITGLTQISGRADLGFEEEIKLDKYYIENWSMWMDLYILLKTPFVVLSKRGAY